MSAARVSGGSLGPKAASGMAEPVERLGIQEGIAAIGKRSLAGKQGSGRQLSAALCAKTSVAEHIICRKSRILVEHARPSATCRWHMGARRAWSYRGRERKDDEECTYVDRAHVLVQVREVKLLRFAAAQALVEHLWRHCRLQR